MWFHRVGKPLLNQKYLPIKTLKFYLQVSNIFRLEIYSSERSLSNNFPSFHGIWFLLSSKYFHPSASPCFSILQPIQISVSFTLILGPRALSWTSINSLLVSTIETYSLSFCPTCLLIPLWVNLGLIFFTLIPELPSVIRESQINRVFPWNKFMCCNCNRAL